MKIKKKPVKIFRESNLLGVFESAKELERNSEEMLGVKLLQGHISSCCLGKKEKYKGFTFKYVD